VQGHFERMGGLTAHADVTEEAAPFWFYRCIVVDLLCLCVNC